MEHHGIYIFGAHSRAQTLAIYLQSQNPGLKIEAFLYDNEERNPEEIGGVPVLSLDRGGFYTSYPVYIATRGVFHEKVEAHLRQIGFEAVCPVTVELDLQLRNAYLKKYFTDIQRDFVKIDDLDQAALPSAAVYVAKSIYDSSLTEPYELKPYEKVIQAGAALTAEILADAVVRDDRGDHISEKNKQFCELTAMYWIWKHAREEIVGLVHYRRHFILPKDWLERMTAHNVDVILPVPLYVAPSLRENYRMRHNPSDWDCMMDYLKRRDFEEYAKAEQFFQKNLYSPCNMFIMRRNVLNELCEWLFPVLFAVAEQGKTREEEYQNRYPGFLSERLLTFFFETHRDRYKVIYADKNFLS